MAPRKKNGRAAAEAAYANLLKENTALVGDVGEAFDFYVAKLDEATQARERYEQARAAAVKRGAITNDQLDQMGYKRSTKLPSAPERPKSTAEASPSPKNNGAARPAAPQLANASAGTGEAN